MLGPVEEGWEQRLVNQQGHFIESHPGDDESLTQAVKGCRNVYEAKSSGSDD